MGRLRRCGIIGVGIIAILMAGAPGAGAGVAGGGGSAAPVTVTIDGPGKGLTFPVRPLKRTVCDPDHWAQPGGTACTLGISGTFTGRMTASDTGADLGPVRGTYRGRLDVTTAVHSPVCLETGGSFTFAVVDGRGRRLGSVTSALDQSDSEICQPEPGSTGRTFFLRADPTGGTGAFAGVDGGNWLLTGSGRLAPGRCDVYRDTLAVHGEVEARLPRPHHATVT